MANLKEEIKAIAKEKGIDKVGFTTKNCLQDAPPSGDLSYVLANALSAISLLVAFDKTAIRKYLSKQDQMEHTRDHRLAYIKLRDAATAIQSLLREKGFEADAPLPNFAYRKDQPFMAMAPPLSHRYVAVASGLGWLGWSGNLVTPEYGAPVALTSVVTSAYLEPDPPIEGESCKACHLCVASCPSSFMSRSDEVSVKIAGRTYKYNRKATNLRCNVTCGGANGVRCPDAKWSTWSYKVLDLPGSGDDESFINKVLEYGKDPGNRRLRALIDVEKLDINGGDEFDRFVDRLLLTCCNCMLICWPELKDRKENYLLLTTSGRVVKSNNALTIVP